MSGYEFSHLYHAALSAFSPGSTFVATIHGRRLIVRSTNTLSIVRTFQCLDPTDTSSTPAPSSSATTTAPTPTSKAESNVVDHLSWSADSLYIAAFSSRESTVWIFGLTDDGNGQGGEVARIGGNNGVDGLARMEWGKNGREILAWSEHTPRITVYDLSDNSASYIQNPKAIPPAYSPNSRYLAVAERHASKDHVGIYDTENNYSLLRHFSISTADVQSLSWSPCGRYIAAIDSLLQYAVYVYSPLGPLLHALTPASSSFTSDPGLGVRTIAWAPGGRWLVVGGWDGQVRIMESESGRCIATLNWAPKTVERDTVTWREPSDWVRETRGRGIVQFDRTVGSTPLPVVRTDLTKSPPRSGISQLSFDAEGTLLLVRLETQPSVAHIHTFLPTPTSTTPKLSHLAALVLNEPIRSAQWCPGKQKLVLNSKAGAVFFWDGDGGWVEEGAENSETRGGLMEGVGIPTSSPFVAADATWAPDGNALAIVDRANGQFCVLYDDPSEQGDSRWDYAEGLTHVSEEEEVDQGDSDRSLIVENLWLGSRPCRAGGR